MPKLWVRVYSGKNRSNCNCMMVRSNQDRQCSHCTSPIKKGELCIRTHISGSGYNGWSEKKYYCTRCTAFEDEDKVIMNPAPVNIPKNVTPFDIKDEGESKEGEQDGT